MSVEPDPHAAMRALALELDATAHGARAALIEEAAARMGLSRAALYQRLREVGWASGRRVRADKGRTRVPDATLDNIAAMQRAGRRENGKQVLHTPTAVSIAVGAGIAVPVSAAHLQRLLRARKLDAQSKLRERPVQPLRAPHPNHTHQVDPSLCLLYYLGGRQFMIRDDEFYKNKLERVAKIKLKVWRYVLYDRASGVIQVRYYEAAGENSAALFEFLMWAWSRKPDLTPHGVPKILLWDKGSANTSFAVARVCEALEVTPIAHAAGNARAKGGVEGAQNIVETSFESRLRFEPVADCAALNAAAAAWAEAYNANRLPGLDSRLRRSGIAPVARYDLWHLIRAEELRELPPVEQVRAYAEGREAKRVVHPDLTVHYRHPRAQATCTYSVAGLAGVCVGDPVELRPLLFGDRAVTLRVARYDGEPLVYRLEPSVEYDRYGQVADAPEIGAAYARPKATDIDRSAARLDALLYPSAEGVEEIRRQRAQGFVPFDGALKSVSPLLEIERTTYLPRQGTPIALAGPVVEAAPLSPPEAVDRLLARGIDVPGLYDRVKALYPQGVMEEEFEQLAARFSAEAPAARMVSG